MQSTRVDSIPRALRATGLAALLVAATAAQAQVDVLPGPSGSQRFGARVLVLPNGNLAVNDPAGAGAVHLYRPDLSPIATLRGTSPTDAIGSGGLVGLGDGHFVVISPEWRDAAGLRKAAVTWVDGTTGLDGEVSPQNSIIDDTPAIGELTVVPLPTGRYLVVSARWNNVGAVRLAQAGGVSVGPTSAANALVGSANGDVPVVHVLANGNYVVAIATWSQGTGAVAWCPGTTGCIGAIDAVDALVGSTSGDRVGQQVAILANGHYVVGSPQWDRVTPQGTLFDAGAATWCSGAVGCRGQVTTANSLVGNSAFDRVGTRIEPLVNGNYVVSSPEVSAPSLAGPQPGAGATTWAHGETGLVGVVGPGNSVMGSVRDSRIGLRIVALTNGHYVILSPKRRVVRFEPGSGFVTCRCGSATWADGTRATTGSIDSLPALLGASDLDEVGSTAVALANGHYAVASPFVDLPGAVDAGAVTWQSGTSPQAASPDASNSLVGTQAGDGVGSGLLALGDGNYVVGSAGFRVGNMAAAGAATWRPGSSASPDVVGAENSLLGSAANQRTGTFLHALPGGRYAIGVPEWSTGNLELQGALAISPVGAPLAGILGPAHALVGSSSNDGIGGESPLLLPDDLVVFVHPFWNHPATQQPSGAMTVMRPGSRPTGTIDAGNSLLLSQIDQGLSARYRARIAYDGVRARLAVGEPMANRVVLLTRADNLYANGFE
jgi:hypothetical protein